MSESTNGFEMPALAPLVIPVSRNDHDVGRRCPSIGRNPGLDSDHFWREVVESLRIEPIGSELKSKQVGVRRRVVFRSINSLMGSVSRLQRRSRICTGGLQVGRPDIRH